MKFFRLHLRRTTIVAAVLLTASCTAAAPRAVPVVAVGREAADWTLPELWRQPLRSPLVHTPRLAVPSHQSHLRTVRRASRTGRLAGSKTIVALGRKMNANKFGDQHWPALYALWTAESRWNPDAVNRSSGACGIPQFLPCKGPNGKPRHKKRPAFQIADGLAHIERRYGSPSRAWAHFKRKGWY